MVEPTGTAGLVIAIISALGGIGACAHFKMKSNCCSFCNSECWDNGTERKASTSALPVLTPPHPQIKTIDV